MWVWFFLFCFVLVLFCFCLFLFAFVSFCVGGKNKIPIMLSGKQRPIAPNKACNYVPVCLDRPEFNGFFAMVRR